MIARRVAATATVAACMAVALSASAFAQHRGHDGAPFGGLLFKALATIGGKAADINEQAMHVYKTVPRDGSCEDRRKRWLAILPDALLLGRYSRDIYDRNHETSMRKAGQARLELSAEHTAYFEATGARYAEVHTDRERRRIVVVFRGTRIEVRSDLTTSALNFAGIETGYYDWAASLVAGVVREHPGLDVVVTGHSLGGGLALYAVSKNPGVRGFVFNPAGLSAAAWMALAPDERDRFNQSVTVVSLRNFWSIEPVTALSLAGRSVLPGHVFVAQADALRPAKLHTAATLVGALERVSERQAEGSVCEGDLGILVD